MKLCTPTNISDCSFYDVTNEKLIEWFSILRHRPVVWTNGVFDILHTGHLHLFQFCKDLLKEHHVGCLVVGINSDESAKSLNKSHPLINNEIDRAKMVISQKDVDYVVIFDEPNPVACMELIKPDYFVKGGDYKIEDLPENEKATVGAYGGKVLVSGNVEGKSTTGIYEKIFDEGYDEGIKAYRDSGSA